MFTRKIISLAILSSAVALAACNDKPVESESVAALEPVAVVAATVDGNEKPAMSATYQAVETSTVTAIDLETRTVTLLDEAGVSNTVTVSEEARNLGQVSVGDIVTIEVVKNLTIEVMTAENARPEAAEAIEMIRAEEGDMPGMAEAKSMIEVSIVEAIDLEANTFKLRDVNGNVTEYTARNPENLKHSAVGDAVVVTMTEAMAISVAKGANAE